MKTPKPVRCLPIKEEGYIEKTEESLFSERLLAPMIFKKVMIFFLLLIFLTVLAIGYRLDKEVAKQKEEIEVLEIQVIYLMFMYRQNMLIAPEPEDSAMLRH